MGGFAGWERRVARAWGGAGVGSAVSKGRTAFGALRGARSSSLAQAISPSSKSLFSVPGPMHGPTRQVGGLFRGNSAGIPRRDPRIGSALPRRPGVISPGGGALPKRLAPGGGALPRRTPGGYRTMGGVSGHRGNAYAGKYQMPVPTRPNSQLVSRSSSRYSPPRRAVAPVRARRTPAAMAPPPKSRFSLRGHADKASAHVLAHKGKYALGGIAAVGVAGYMTRRGPGTGQSTGGVPTGMYGY